MRKFLGAVVFFFFLLSTQIGYAVEDQDSTTPNLPAPEEDKRYNGLKGQYLEDYFLVIGPSLGKYLFSFY